MSNTVTFFFSFIIVIPFVILFPFQMTEDVGWSFIPLKTLARQYNALFFQGMLKGVRVCWSRRMTISAGICHYIAKGQYTAITIKLSEPLLKFRPHYDLQAVLLHEMIHAYLFVKGIIEDVQHGPYFRREMERVSRESGIKVTIYHSFNEEVAYYRQRKKVTKKEKVREAKRSENFTSDCWKGTPRTLEPSGSRENPVDIV